MNKEEFLNSLNKNLKYANEDYRQSIIYKYEQYFDEKIFLGFKEEKISSSLENPKKIASTYNFKNYLKKINDAKINIIHLLKLVTLSILADRANTIYILPFIVASILIGLPLVLAGILLFLSIYIIGNGLHIVPIIVKTYIKGIGINYIKYLPPDIYISLFQIFFGLGIICFCILLCIFTFRIHKFISKILFKYLKYQYKHKKIKER